MNNKLENLYKEKFIDLAPKLKDYNLQSNYNQKATNPFLLCVPENYNSYKNKIMIFGQETNTWCSECGNNSAFSNNIDQSLRIYRKFYLENGIKHYRGAFWNEFKRIKRNIESHDAFIIWNNINKIGRIGKGHVNAINKLQFEYFNVIQDELLLLKPNIVIFFTGPNYDFFIEKNCGNFKKVKVSDYIYELEFENDFGISKIYKTYHPNGLYRLSLNRIVMPKLIELIKQSCI